MSEPSTNDNNQETKTSESKKSQKNKIMQKYYSDKYLLEKQALSNGFGKMVNAINQTNPKYSFGKEKRFFSVFKADNLPYEHKELEDSKYGNINIGYHNKVKNKNRGNTNFTSTFNHFDSYNPYNNKNKNLKDINFISSGNNATDYYYVPPPPHYYKYSKSPVWGFGRAKRILYDDKGKYEHYNLPYNKKIDTEKIHKKWRSRVIGGDIGLDDRFQEDKKFAEQLELPGPGRYNPKDIYFKYNHYPGGYMGMKLDCCEPVKNKNLRNEMNLCYNANEKYKTSIAKYKNFVHNGKIQLDFGKNNYLNENWNKKSNFNLNKNESEYIQKFKNSFSLKGKKFPTVK
jgi:hypothetical protein